MIFYYGLSLGLKSFAPTQPEWELFDLNADPHEMKNIYDEEGNQILVDSLKSHLKLLKREFDDLDEAYPALQAVGDVFW